MNVVNPKVLIVAQNASAKFGGEAFIPLKYFQILRRRGYRVKLIAHHRNREELAAFLPDALDDITFVQDSIWHRIIWRTGSVFSQRARDALFGTLMGIVNDLYQARHIRELLRKDEANIIHQPIPVSPRAPSSIYGFGVPVVIGPMNGGMTFPPGYNDYESRGLRGMIAVGRGFAIVVNHLIPGKHRAAALLVANSRTRAALPINAHSCIIELVENGVDMSVWTNYRSPSSKPRPTNSIRLVFVGRLIALKGIDITLEALAIAQSTGVDARLDIIGEGPQGDILERLAKELGLNSSVTFHGFRPQAECASIIGAADALILNSLCECGGAVVLEAMSLGLPIIASDWGGPADYVDSSCGILVHPVPRTDFAQRLAEAIGYLANNPKQRQRMGEAGAKKVLRDFDWEKKVDRMIEIYIQLLNPGTPNKRSEK